MSPIEEAIIRRKLGIMAENLAALIPIEGMTTEEYLNDVYKRKATERLLQELIEAAIDIIPILLSRQVMRHPLIITRVLSSWVN